MLDSFHFLHLVDMFSISHLVNETEFLYEFLDPSTNAPLWSGPHPTIFLVPFVNNLVTTYRKNLSGILIEKKYI